MSFFQKPGPLMQEAEVGGGAAPASRAPNRAKPSNVVADVGGAVADATAPKSMDVSTGIPGTTVEDLNIPLSELSISASRVDRELATPRGLRPETPPVEKQPPGDIQVTMETGPVMTEAEQAMMAGLGEMERAYEFAIGGAQMKAMKAAEATQLQFAEIAREDANAARMLAREVFPRVRKVNEELTRDIEAASAMRINPHNYFQSIGRAGRAASVIAVGISQLAAGAGNANSVWNRVQAAIERDIAAQKDNLTNVWAGLEAKRTLNQDDLDLLERRVAFDDHARAVAYAGLAAQVGAAKQRFMSETVHLNTQMLEERALQASIIAAAEARAKYTSFKMDARVNSVWGAMKKAQTAKQLAALRQNLVSAENDVQAAQQAMQGLGGPLTDLDGNVIDYPVGAQEQAPGAPVAETPTAPGAAPTSPASRVATRRRPTPTGDVPVEAPSSPVEATTDFQAPSGTPAPLADQDSQAAPQEQAPAMTAADIEPDDVDDLTPEEAAQIRPETVARMRPETIASLPTGSIAAMQGLDPDVVAAGSYENAARASRGQAPDPEQTLERLAARINDPNNLNIAVANTLGDAQALSRVYAPPDATDRVFFVTDKDGNEIFNAQLWQKANELWQHHKRFPESFVKERPNVDIFTGETKPGYNNVIEIGGGLVVHIKADEISADGRSGLLASAAERAEIKQDIRKTYVAAARVAQAAADYDMIGTSKSVFGWRVTKDGIKWVPGNADLRHSFERMQRSFKKGGVQAIKALDPAGRLSDQDIKFGMALDAAIIDGETVGIDQAIQIYERYFGKGTGSRDAVRESARKMFALTAKEYLTDLDARVSDRVVLSPEALRMQLNQARDVYNFIGDAQAATTRMEEEELGPDERSLGGRVWDAVRPSANPLDYIPGVGTARQLGGFVDIFTGGAGDEE